MSRRTLTAAALGVALASLSSVAQAQNSLTQGLSLGLDLTYASQEINAEDGSGLGSGLRVGYGFGRMLQPFLNVSTTNIDVDGGDFGLQQLDLGTRVHFGRLGAKLVPFADAAVSFRRLEADVENDPELGSGDLEASSTAFTLGGGVQYLLNDKWALDGGLQYTVGKFGDWKWDGDDMGMGDVDGNALRVNLGFTWFPMAR